jgi:LPS export ABC transporter permease LptF
MKIIDRYVGKNVFVTMLIGILVLSLVLVLGKLFKELLDLIINNDVPLGTVLAFLAFAMPFSLTFTIPWGFLTALLLVCGRMSADNELIALRANGVSVGRVCVPIFILAVLLTATCFWINATVAPKAEQQLTTAVFQILTNDPISLFTADEVVDKFPDRRVYVGGKEGEYLKNLIVFELEEGMPMKVVYAKWGQLRPDPANMRLLLHLYDARFEQRDAEFPKDVYKIRPGVVMQEGTFPIKLDAMYDEYTKGRRLSSYALQELSSKDEAGKSVAEKDGHHPLAVRVEMNKRFSASMACLAFALIAVPLGITAHRKETSVGFAFSLVIAFAYFFFIILADTFRDNPKAMPELLIWIPNVIFITLGSYLFWRLSKR